MAPRRRLAIGLIALGACASCDDAATRQPGPAPGASSSVRRPPPASGLLFSHDDVQEATARARKAGKALLVDAWAPWCHTCLSMKHYVLTDPSLRPLADRVEPVAVDTDRAANAEFLERHEVRAWPTFFVIDPEDGAVVGAWPGAASARELREHVERSLDVLDARRKGSLREGSPLAFLVDAKAAGAAGNDVKAATLYEKAVGAANPDWKRRSEALLGWVTSLYHARDWVACARVGKRHVGEVRGAAIPADFVNYYWGCMTRLAKGPAREAAEREAIAVLRRVTKNPSPEMSVDDVSDALAILAEALESTGDHAGWRRAHEKRVMLMEKAARAAPTPAMAQTYDYARANAYVLLGRPHVAVRMLRERERQLPDSCEPPARLASVLVKMRAWKPALEAVDRALARSYGPRRLRYLATKGRILSELGRQRDAVETMRLEVEGYEALPPGQADREALNDVRKRLDELERKLRDGADAAPAR